MQLRDYLALCLYEKSSGYFMSSGHAPPIGSLDDPIDFQSLYNRQAYLYEVNRRYAELGDSWLTPAEIFTPYYGRTIGNYIVQQHLRAFDMGCSHKASPIELVRNAGRKNIIIYEIGAGTGTLAKDILNLLKEVYPGLYQHALYTIIEISPALAAMQRDRLIKAGHTPYEDQHHNAGTFRIEIGDALEPSVWRRLGIDGRGPENLTDDNTECFILATEVLDNCPHDKVDFSKSAGAWREAIVGPEVVNGRLLEHMQPLSGDPLINRCLGVYHNIWTQRMPKIPTKRKFLRNMLLSAWSHTKNWILDGVLQGDPIGRWHHIVFLPTGALRLFDALHDTHPNHRIIAVDFDSLPDVKIPGRNAPLVSQTRDGRCIDFGSYLVAPGKADVFFPTDFQYLGALYEESRQRLSLKLPGIMRHRRRNVDVQTFKASVFLKEWMLEEDRLTAQTKNGYLPMIEDYTNTSVLTS